MFQDWGFLLAEIWGLLALAAVIGLVSGWLIWGRDIAPTANGEVETLRADLDRVRAMHVEKDERIRALDAELGDLRSQALAARQARAEEPPVAASTVPEARAVPVESAPRSKPTMLDTARGGQPDDLKRIKGIGAQLEKMCFQMGFFHYDQIAAWSEDEVAWVDAHLEGFKGRVTRDAWVEQAKLLASGAGTDFSRKVDDGDVY